MTILSAKQDTYRDQCLGNFQQSARKERLSLFYVSPTGRFNVSQTALVSEHEKGDEDQVSTVSSKDYVDARIGEVIAVQKAEFAAMETKIDKLITKVDQLPSFKAMLLTAVTVAFAALGIVYAGMQYGAGTYGVGLTAAPIVEQAITKQADEFRSLLATQADRDASQDAQLVEIGSKLDLLIGAITAGNNGVSPPAPGAPSNN